MGLDRVLCFRTLGRNRQKKEVARAKRKAEVEEGGEKERRGGPSETKCSQERGRPLSGGTRLGGGTQSRRQSWRQASRNADPK